MVKFIRSDRMGVITARRRVMLADKMEFLGRSHGLPDGEAMAAPDVVMCPFTAKSRHCDARVSTGEFCMKLPQGDRLRLVTSFAISAASTNTTGASDGESAEEKALDI
jgi:hypothetical protein